MKLYSFRSIITITIFLVVGIISFFAMYLYNNYFGKEVYKHVEKDIVSVLSILQDQYIHSVSENGGQILHPLLDDLKKNDHLRNTYLFNARDSLIYSPGLDSLGLTIGRMNKMMDIKEDISIQSFISFSYPFMRAYIKLQNSPRCINCHNSSEKYLGMLVFDISLAETSKNIVLTRNFSILYSALIVVFILISVFIVHYRFVKKSLFNFHSTIDKINKGNLAERLSIPKSRELGELGNNFNTMVLTFQKAQEELKTYHEKELEDKHKMATIGEMAARLAHEIRNPLTGIANAIEILVKQMPEDQNKHVMEEIQRQAERVNKAISNMLRFSRSSEITKVNADINAIILALVFFIKNQTKHKKIEFRHELDKKIPAFPFDPEQIENVLLNLGINAIQAIPETGTITFKTYHDPLTRKVYISVEDTGVGIPSRILNDIFNPFFTTRMEGTGLGLAITKEIVEKHDGEIWVESKESNGSNFFISLPMDDFKP